MAVLPLGESVRWTGPCVSVGGLGLTWLSLPQQELQPQQDADGHRHAGRREGPGSREASSSIFFQYLENSLRHLERESQQDLLGSLRKSAVSGIFQPHSNSGKVVQYCLRASVWIKFITEPLRTLCEMCLRFSSFPSLASLLAFPLYTN